MMTEAEYVICCLLKELEDQVAMNECGCGHPACKSCQDDAYARDMIDWGDEKLIEIMEARSNG